MKFNSTSWHFYRVLALVWVVLVGVFEPMPDGHGHEDLHACVNADGSFYYLETDPHNAERDPDQTRLVGYRVGHSHAHHVCALCKLVSGQVGETLPVSWLSAGDNTGYFWRVDSFVRAFVPKLPARAPPKA